MTLVALSTRKAARLLASAAIVTALGVTGVAHALSELKPGETQPVVPPGTPNTPTEPDGNTVPAPDPITPPAQTDEETPPATNEEQPAEANPPIDEGKANIARPDVDPDAPLPEIQYDLTKLPEPVARMRQLLIDAAVSGDIETLRPLIGTGARAPLLSLTEATDADPVAFLKSQAGDEAGREILAILEEVLNAGYVQLNAGKPEELYVWPYYFAMPLNKLTPRQTVELFKIITGGEYQEMEQFGTYIFYRVGITPAGEWAFFVTGE
jgi:hypothetical protein